MANNFNAQTTPAETVFPNAQQNTSNGNSYFRRPIYTSLWTRQSSVDINNPVYASGEEQNQSKSSTKPNLINTLVRSLSRTSDSIDSFAQNAFSSTNRTNNQLPQESPPNYQTTVINNSQPVQIVQNPYFTNREQSSQALPIHQTATYSGNNNSNVMQDETVYYEEEYQSYEKPQKKKGLSSKIDRFVQRFGKLNKQPQTSSFESDHYERELTADELALNSRYSDKTRTKIITLPLTDQTQPVDVRFHSESNLIYLCDVSRSLIEIYDINGTLLHTVQDATMSKFQPTAIVLAFDGTMIIGSHFSHCLYMYAPSESSDAFSYKQYRLGSQGTQAHEFQHPAGIAMDEKTGNVYICDRSNYRIQMIRPEGVCERIIELFLNTKKKTPLEPIRVSIQQGLNQLVCLIGSGDAVCFIPKDSTGPVYVDPLYVMDENGLNIDGASGLAVDTHNRIFISDTNHHRIVICTPEGSFITSIGTEGDGLDQLKRPCGLDVSPDGTLVVTEPGNKRLHLFGLMKDQPNVDNSTPLVEISTEAKEEVADFL